MVLSKLKSLFGGGSRRLNIKDRFDIKGKSGMGSMGSVVGEKLTRAIEQATKSRLPLVIVSGSGGGARMHEGILSLMQMGKVCGALARYDEAGGLFISVLTNPTMGGVAASFALPGDITLA